MKSVLVGDFGKSRTRLGLFDDSFNLLYCDEMATKGVTSIRLELLKFLANLANKNMPRVGAFSLTHFISRDGKRAFSSDAFPIDVEEVINGTTIEDLTLLN